VWSLSPRLCYEGWLDEGHEVWRNQAGEYQVHLLWISELTTEKSEVEERVEELQLASGENSEKGR